MFLQLVNITRLCGLAAAASVFLPFSHVNDSCQSFTALMCHLVLTPKIAGSAELSLALCLTECPGYLVPGQDHLLPEGLPGQNQAPKGRAKVFIIVIIVTFSVSQHLWTVRKKIHKIISDCLILFLDSDSMILGQQLGWQIVYNIVKWRF